MTETTTNNNPETKVYAKKDFLQQDVLIRIAETIDYAGALKKSIWFAEKERINPNKQDNIMFETHGIKNTILKKLTEPGLVKQEPDIIVRYVDQEIFGGFMISFNNLWMETKDNIQDEVFEEIGNKNKSKEMKKEFTDLFAEEDLEDLDPIKCLELFSTYISCLHGCGIMDLTYKPDDSKTAYNNTYGN